MKPIKNFIKKLSIYKILRCIIWQLKSILPFFKYKFNLPNRRNNNVNSKIKVGFLLQMSSIWDKESDIYEEMRNRTDFETYLFVIPECSIKTYKIDDFSYENNYFLKNYPQAIKYYNSKGQSIVLKDYNLDYVFYQRPYDAYLPEPLKSKKVMRFAKCCYIPYGFTASDNFNDGNVYNDFFDRMYFIFMDSIYMQKLLMKRCFLNLTLGLQKVEYYGYPSLKRYLDMNNSFSPINITWTPRWSSEKIIGGSCFLKFKNDFLNLCKVNNNHKYLFRPHPLMFEELEKKNLMSHSEIAEYCKSLNNLSVISDITTPIDIILEKTDILITDFSTIIGSFFVTGKPIIYCYNGIEFNEPYQELSQYIYTANNWNEVLEYLEQLEKGNDFLKKQRLEYIKNRFNYDRNAAKRITDAVKSDYMQMYKK